MSESLRLHPIHLPMNLTVVEPTGFWKLRALVSLAFFASAFYGIHRRVPLTWKLGWGVIVGGYLWFIVSVLSTTLKMPQPDRWIASCSIVIGTLLVVLYWGYWWWRQKQYFGKIPQ